MQPGALPFPRKELSPREALAVCTPPAPKPYVLQFLSPVILGASRVGRGTMPLEYGFLGPQVLSTQGLGGWHGWSHGTLLM